MCIDYTLDISIKQHLNNLWLEQLMAVDGKLFKWPTFGCAIHINTENVKSRNGNSKICLSTNKASNIYHRVTGRLKGPGTVTVLIHVVCH